MKNLFFLFASLVFITACQSASEPLAESASADTLSPYRPVYHFTPLGHWMNDPNGMVYYEGEYHLFYQHYPDSTVWGPMHWGHAVSEDLVHWERLPIALYPDSLGYIFSGSAVVDWNNTSGFGTKENPPLVAIFTYHNAEKASTGAIDYQTQGIAYSTDRGRTWTKYEENPVVPNPGIEDFRDPKVFWHAPDKKWVMTLAVSDHVSFYASSDLKSWTKTGEFGQKWGSHGGVWECPDLFPINIDNTQEEKWVLLLSINPGGPNEGSATQYFVGNFDGQTFTLDESFQQDVRNENGVWLDYGPDNYAGVTWADVPKENGRRIFMGWMSNWHYGQQVPTEEWRSAMTVPRTLQLIKMPRGLRVVSQPVQELQALRQSTQKIKPTTVQDSLSLLTIPEGEPATLALDVALNIAASSASAVEVVLSNDLGEKVRIGYDPGDEQYYIDRSQSGKTDFSDKFSGRATAPRITESDTLRLSLMVDVASVELFADEGKTVMTAIFFPNEGFNQVSLRAPGGTVPLLDGEVDKLVDTSVIAEAKP